MMMLKLWKTHGLDEVCSGNVDHKSKDAGTMRKMMMLKLWKTHGLDEVCSGNVDHKSKDAGTM
jgi:hypothetical protein